MPKKNNTESLAQAIRKHRKLYYAGTPEISDMEYDELEGKLRTLDPNHPALSEVGAAINAENGVKVRHAIPMLSLGKTYAIKDLLSWQGARELVATHKIDGVSISLIYQEGELTQAKTRGDGYLGEDVTAKIRYIKGCREKIHPFEIDNKKNIEVRGEICCLLSQFEALAKEMQRRGFERPVSPRNIVAGVLGRKLHFDLAAYFSFFAFDAMYEEGGSPLRTEMATVKWLEENQFEVPVPKLCQNEADIAAYLNETHALMDEGDYSIDGVVFSFNDRRLHEQMGFTAHHPRYRMAFKWQGQTAKTEIESIEWATSRLGIVTPVARVRPVQLSGATITNVTLHNAAHVRAVNLKAGDEIEIVRSGEVIPKFLTLIKAAPGKAKLPKLCPACNFILVDDGVRLNCENREGCPAQQSGFILNWIRSVGIDDLSDKRLNALIEIHAVDHPAALYKLSVEDFLQLPLTKHKMAEKLYANIQSKKNLPLVDYLVGLGIKGMGKSSWLALLEYFPSLELLQKATTNDIVGTVKGFAEKMATQVVLGFKEKSDDIKKLKAAGVVPQSYKSQKAGNGHPLAGKVFVISGNLSKPRDQIIDELVAIGAKVSSSVSKNTFALITDDPSSDSSKIVKAKELGIPFWDEETLNAKLAP